MNTATVSAQDENDGGAAPPSCGSASSCSPRRPPCSRPASAARRGRALGLDEQHRGQGQRHERADAEEGDGAPAPKPEASRAGCGEPARHSANQGRPSSHAPTTATMAAAPATPARPAATGAHAARRRSGHRRSRPMRSSTRSRPSAGGLLVGQGGQRPLDPAPRSRAPRGSAGSRRGVGPVRLPARAPRFPEVEVEELAGKSGADSVMADPLPRVAQAGAQRDDRAVEARLQRPLGGPGDPARSPRRTAAAGTAGPRPPS